MCALACPLGIDTGTLIKTFRARERTARDEQAGLAAAKRWATVERASRAGLRARPLSKALSAAGRALLSDELVPSWPDAMPPPAPAKLPATRREGAAAVYLPACINRIFGPSLPEALVRVSERAGLPVWIPDDVPGHCCAVPWSSKGLSRGAEWMGAHTAAAVKRWLGNDGLPLVTDASSCTHGLHAILEGVEVLDSIDWVHDRVLPQLELKRKASVVAVHPPCSVRHLTLLPKLRRVAEALADEVVVPATATCCGMAGDRGLLHPELPQSATKPQRAEVDSDRFDSHISSNRTCEIGLELGTGRKYRSFVHVLDELSS